jgi:hypothetical protein
MQKFLYAPVLAVPLNQMNVAPIFRFQAVLYLIETLSHRGQQHVTPAWD